MGNKVHVHPGQPEMQVEVILASKSAGGNPPIYTIRARYPRVIHSEIMTHRVFGRNARSSRAVPVARMLDEIKTSPFIPWHWGKNQKGMQASEECNNLVVFPLTPCMPDGQKIGDIREDAWEYARDHAVNMAEAFMDAGYHKQNVNRLLEPFMWIDVLITSTDWANFLWLRDHDDAEPHLQDLARLVSKAIDEADIQTLLSEEWHLPYVSTLEMDDIAESLNYSYHAEVINVARKISAARCARISYAPFDGDASYRKELDRFESLVSSNRVHASPMEHIASPDQWLPNCNRWANPELHGNLRGWIQFRKTIPNNTKEEAA